MEVRNISRNRQSRKGVSSRSIADISGNGANDLRPVSFGRVDDRASADSVDCHAIDQIRMPPLLSGTDIARKETEGMRSDSRKSKPSNLGSDRQRDARWEEWYRTLWQLKMARLNQDHR